MTKTDEIRALLAQGVKQVEIAKLVGVTQAYVSQVNCGVHTRLKRKEKQAQRQREAGQYSKKSFDKRKKKARKNGREFSIKWEDLEHPTRCPILGIELDYLGVGEYGSQPSMDRIDNSLGYIPGNVWIISMKANTIKKQKDLEQLLQELKQK